MHFLRSNLTVDKSEQIGSSAVIYRTVQAFRCINLLITSFGFMFYHLIVHPQMRRRSMKLITTRPARSGYRSSVATSATRSRKVRRTDFFN